MRPPQPPHPGAFWTGLALLVTAAFAVGLTSAREVPMKPEREVATLGAGCFWCVEAVFAELRGVESAVSGYAGGTVPNPTYEQVCTGTTGHAEVVQVTFDPAVLSFEDLLRVFFATHDPTTKNRQGADSGTQYRSVIFYHSEAQRAAAQKILKEAQADWENPVVTQIVPFSSFFRAEVYHQDFFAVNPGHPYCQVVINPKLQKFRKLYGDRLKR